MKAVLSGRDPGAGGAVVVVVPAGRQAEGSGCTSGVRRDQELWGGGELWVRPLNHSGTELESKSCTGRGDWKGEGQGRGGQTFRADPVTRRSTEVGGTVERCRLEEWGDKSGL